MGKILVTGACGQLGSELTTMLSTIYGPENLIVSDIRNCSSSEGIENFEILDVLDKNRLTELSKKYQIDEIYHLAAILSAKGEQNPVQAWDINMRGLLNILDFAKEINVKKIFWPSSIAVFGPTTPRISTPQYTVTEPNTVYGISKLAGERWCEYYFNKYNLDIRSLRYPGLISYKTLPGGGTTDYAVEIFFEALKKGSFTSFLSKDTRLPMMYMEDAIRGSVELMESDVKKISVRSSYNFAAMSFTPDEIAQEIKKHIPDFAISYSPDFRQKIADSWPESINDDFARSDWGWKEKYNLGEMTSDILKHLEPILQ